MKSIISSPECGSRVVIHPTRSRLLIRLVFCLHMAAFLLLFFVELNLLLLLIIALLISFSLRQYFISERSISYGLSLQQGEPLLFQNNESSGWQEADVLESFVSRWLIVLKIRTLPDSKQHSLLYAADSVSSLSFRRLVVYLNV